MGHPGVAHLASPLVRRPYDLRHAAVSLWLNAGVPATEVARRVGHGVAVLLKVYANCIDGQAGPANQRIDDPLGGDNNEMGWHQGPWGCAAEVPPSIGLDSIDGR